MDDLLIWEIVSSFVGVHILLHPPDVHDAGRHAHRITKHVLIAPGLCSKDLLPHLIGGILAARVVVLAARVVAY